MIKAIGRLGCPAMLLLCAMVVFAQQDLTRETGLKRFNQNDQLGQSSVWDVRDVQVGDNALAAAISLQQQGGKVHYISGGSRSRKVKISFFQPYRDSRLEQMVELNFDKDKGFIQFVSLTYSLESAYLDTQNVFNQILAGARQKYAEPLSMASLRQSVKLPQGRVTLAQVANKLEVDDAIALQVNDYFSQRAITRNSAFVADENGFALMQFGFQECYLWQQQNFTELLSLCRFKDNSGNQKGQGITLTLYNFAVENAIGLYVPGQHSDIKVEL